LENYTRDTLIFSIQSSLNWYGRFFIEDPGLTIDNTNKYIGIVRLRQLRANNHSCVVPPLMRFVTVHCISSFADGPEYEDFSVGWGNNSESDKFSRMDSVWKYKESELTGTSGYFGELATYPGGGYVATLGRSWKNSIVNMNYLFRNNWIDRFTRSVFFEFLLYSPNGNLFHSVRVAFELAATGLVLTLFNVETAHLLSAVKESSVGFQVGVSLFVLMICALVIKILYRIGKKKELVFKDLWTISDIFIIFLSIACLILFVERAPTVRVFLSEIEDAKPNEFVNYFHLLSTQTTMTILAAILVFIATLRLWKLLRFMSIVRVTEKTLELAFPRLLVVFLYQMLFIFLFQLISKITFANRSEFRSNHDSFMTLTLLGFRFLKTFDFQPVNTPSKRLYFWVYLLGSFFFLTSHIVVIANCYRDARIFYSNRKGYNVFEFLIERYQYYKVLVAKKIGRLRRRGGQDGSTSAEEKAVSAKANMHRYAKCLKISENRMNIMWHLTRGILRNKKPKSKLGKDDKNSMVIIIANLLRKDMKKDIYFFVGSTKTKNAIFVDDLIFKKMEKIGNVLLYEKEKMHRYLFESNSQKFDEIESSLEYVSNLLRRVSFTLYHLSKNQN
ncbi:Polycystin-2, partial [Gonioctena quinquepunctata]